MTTRIRPDTLANTAVTAGTYGGPQQHAVFAVDNQGRLTYASNVTTGVVTAGAGGDSMNIPSIVYNALGQITAVTNTAIRVGSTSQTGVLSLTDSTTSISNTTAATAASVYAAANNAQANVGAGLITATGSWQANVGAGLITATGSWQANVGAGLISVTNGYQANTGAAAISAKDAANITTGTLSVARLGTTGAPQLGSLGVGTAASGTTGEIRATNNITGYYSSDKKFKENVADIENPLDKVNAIGGKTFDWKDEYIEAHGGADEYFLRKNDFGVIAQDVQAVFPIAVRERSDGTLAVDYEKLCALAFAAIRELSAKVESLEKNK